MAAAAATSHVECEKKKVPAGVSIISGRHGRLSPPPLLLLLPRALDAIAHVHKRQLAPIKRNGKDVRMNKKIQKKTISKNTNFNWL